MTMPLAATSGPLATTATWFESCVQPAASVARRARRRLLTDPMVASLSLPQSEIVVEVSQPEPTWLYPALHRLQHLSRLGDNWDSYGGRPLTDKAILTALSVIARLLCDESVPPAIVPTSEGGVQLEWHREGDELEIRVTPNGEISAFRFDEAAGKGTEVDHVSLSNLAPLVALTGRL
ncbi:MAG: hypothetical protein ACREXX_09795 [Gammaproteobacteria bacterium]